LFLEVNAERLNRECCLSGLVLEEERSRCARGGGGGKVMAAPGIGEFGMDWFEEAWIWRSPEEMPGVLYTSVLL
jgi:hypothetical protein